MCHHECQTKTEALQMIYTYQIILKKHEPCIQRHESTHDEWLPSSSDTPFSHHSLHATRSGILREKILQLVVQP